jgi:excisionase family DNA binding protein
MNPYDKLLVSVNEASEMLSISRVTFYKLINAGAVETVKSGHRTLVPVDALKAYVATLRGTAPTPAS